MDLKLYIHVAPIKDKTWSYKTTFYGTVLKHRFYCSVHMIKVVGYA